MIYSSFPKNSFQKNKKQILKLVEKVLDSGNYINGNCLKNFENNFAKYIGSKYALGVGNSTDALLLSLKAVGVKENDEVLVPSHTAPATVISILNCKAKPIFIDVNLDDYNIDYNLIEKNITKNTKCLVIVHLYGQAANLNQILKISKKFNLKVIEDVSQSCGALYNKKKLGSFSDIGCFSFFPTKNLSTIGDSGAIVSNNKNYINKIKMLREYGWDANRNCQFVGINSRLDEVHAEILNYRLKNLDNENRERIKIAKYYLKNVKNSKIILPRVFPERKHIFHLFVVRVKNRNKFIKDLQNEGFKLGIHYERPVHKHAIFKGKKFKKLENTEKISNQVVSLPIYIGLNKKIMSKLVNILNSI